MSLENFDFEPNDIILGFEEVLYAGLFYFYTLYFNLLK